MFVKLSARVWGPVFWNLLFDIAHHFRGYNAENPLKDTELFDFFAGVKNILPCGKCRKHYEKFWLSVQDSQRKCCADIGLEFLFPLKNAVNRRLGSPELSCQAYLEKRSNFPYTGNGLSVAALLDYLCKVVENDPTERSRSPLNNHWCKLTRELVRQIPGYGVVI